MKTHCLICDEQVKNWDEAYPKGEEQIHPVDGTVFRTYGHYGSTVFDPMDASYLEIVVCDQCLGARLDRTYEGVNKEYQAQLDAKRAEMDAMIDRLDLKDLDKE